MNGIRSFLWLSCCVSVLMACNGQPQPTNLSVTEFEKAIAQGNVQILDVRTPGEYQSGHLTHALQANWTDEVQFPERAKALDKSKPVYSYCLSGARSNAATAWLRNNGFNAFNLSGGINAWKIAGKPVEQANTVKQISMEEYLARIPLDKTVLVDIGAVWCPPCKKMAPVVESLVATNGNEFVLVKIDGGDQTNLAAALKADAFPTFIVYKNGKETWRKQGLVDAKELLSKF